MLPGAQRSRGAATARESAAGGAQKRKRAAADAGPGDASRGQAENDDAAEIAGDAPARDGVRETDAAEGLSHESDGSDEHLDDVGDSGRHEQQATAKRQQAGADTGDLPASARPGAKRQADKVMLPCPALRPARQRSAIAAAVLGHA